MPRMRHRQRERPTSMNGAFPCPRRGRQPGPHPALAPSASEHYPARELDGAGVLRALARRKHELSETRIAQRRIEVRISPLVEGIARFRSELEVALAFRPREALH